MHGRFMAILLPSVLGGCVVTPPQSMPISAYERPTPQPRPAAPPGAIYAGGFELFADLRARDVGDILTIRLVERTAAENESSTNTSKASDLDTGMPIIAGGPVTLNGKEILNNEIQGQRSFAGASDSSQSNRIDGTLAVTVVERLANGNLVIEGEKWFAINQGQEFVRVMGIVRPVDIAQDNSIASTKIGDARIEYRGSGTLADANKPGWLTRFFNSAWFPF